MKRSPFLALVSLLFAGPLAAASAGAKPDLPTLLGDPGLGISTAPLWTGPAPGAKGSGLSDTPALTVFLPHVHMGNGTAVVVCPGGGYLGLSSNLEGRQAADWFTVRGITAFVLRYRLGENYLYPAPLEDAERAMRWVRFHAAEYHLSPDRIGMAGFSAGGHLAATTGTVGDPGNPQAADPIDRLDSRPNFLVLAYPWLNAMQPTRPNFLPSYDDLLKIPQAQRKALEKKYTPALHVTASTPPTFIYSTTDDAIVPIQASTDFYDALVAAGVPAELHIFRHGKHGTGMGLGEPALDLWPNLLEAWLRGLGLLTMRPASAK